MVEAWRTDLMGEIVGNREVKASTAERRERNGDSREVQLQELG
jgi:hypothetical protein